MDSDCFSARSSKHFSSLQWLQAQNYNESLQILTGPIVLNTISGSGTLVWFSISDEDVACHLSFPFISQVVLWMLQEKYFLVPAFRADAV